MRYQSASRSHLTLNVSQEAGKVCFLLKPDHLFSSSPFFNQEVRMENKAEPTLTCLHRSLGFARRRSGLSICVVDGRVRSGMVC